MTIAISLKVHEGIVLASDSASTVVGQGPTGPIAINVYNNANKIFNLLKGAPIGASTWGAGAIGQASIATLVKDLRRRFSGLEPDYRSWTIQPSTYRIERVAEQVREFIYEEHYQNSFSDWPAKPDLGMFVVGYSANAMLPEEYQIDIMNNGECGPPRLLRPVGQAGMTWNGQIEAVTRLVCGFAPALPNVLSQHLGIPPDRAEATTQVLQAALNPNLIQDSMPLQDAIDLAEFLTDAAIQFSRFAPGASVVGGPIEIAAISKHEGFRWIRRKHYYSTDLNPPAPAAEERVARLAGIGSEPAPSTQAPRKSVRKTTKKAAEPAKVKKAAKAAPASRRSVM